MLYTKSSSIRIQCNFNPISGSLKYIRGCAGVDGPYIPTYVALVGYEVWQSLFLINGLNSYDRIAKHLKDKYAIPQPK